MKLRLDQLVVDRGLAPSREQAKALIMAGSIFVKGQREDKPGSSFDGDAVIELHGKPLPYVSRGGLKLEKALKVFPIDLQGAVCIDIGASTGGFTDCMLQNGAAKVFSVDVGYGQLDYKLRIDKRVVSMEKTNIRHVTPEMIGEAVDFASVDVSFISLKHVFGPMFAVMKPAAHCVCLIKPQFEAGREKVGKKGVVREASTQLEVILNVIRMAEDNGFTVLDVDYSPIKGPEGNIEFLLYAQKPAGVPAEGTYLTPAREGKLRELVQASHTSLNAGEVQETV